MKIGTLTYWESQENYGQLLQCYALLRFLRQMGHDAFLIKYLSSSTKRPLIQRLKSHIFMPSDHLTDNRQKCGNA